MQHLICVCTVCLGKKNPSGSEKQNTSESKLHLKMDKISFFLFYETDWKILLVKKGLIYMCHHSYNSIAMATDQSPWLQFYHHGNSSITMAIQLYHHSYNSISMATALSPWLKLHHHGYSPIRMITMATIPSP